MADRISAKHLALFAENPRRYCADELRSDDFLDDDIDPGWRGRGTAVTLAGLGGLALPGAAAAGVIVGPQAGIGTAVAGSLALAAGGLLAWRGKRAPLQSTERIHEMFRLDARRYALRCADILGNRGRAWRNPDLLAVPHALFDYTADRNTVHVGMLVARPLPEEGLPDRDLYRITLHMGLVRERLKADRVSGSIRFADRVLRIPHSDALYRALLRLIPELHTGKARGAPADGRPLRIRWQHSTERKQRAAMIDRPTAANWPQSHIV